MAQGTTIREYCGEEDAIIPFYIYGNGRLTVNSHPADPMVNSAIYTSQMPVIAQNLSGSVVLNQVQFPKAALGMQIVRGGGVPASAVVVDIQNCTFAENFGELNISSAGITRIQGNTFSNNTLALGNVDNATIEENKWLHASNCLRIDGGVQNTTIKCNSFRMDLSRPLASDHYGILVNTNGSINQTTVGSITSNNIGSSTARCGNMFAVDQTDQDILAANAFTATSFASPQTTRNTTPTSFWRYYSLVNRSPIDLNYFNFGNEFLGNYLPNQPNGLAGDVIPSLLFPTNVANVASSFCTNSQIVFPQFRVGVMNEAPTLSSLEKPLKVYPVPFSSQVFIETSVLDASIEFFDASGRIIKKINHLESKSIVETSSWPAGFYSIRMIGKDLVFTDKIVKQ